MNTPKIEPLIQRPSLDEHDFKTVRELYIQTQHWARHYETLTVSTNVMLVSAATLFVGLATHDAGLFHIAGAVWALPILLSLVGLGLTYMLFTHYRFCIERIIVMENIMNCYDTSKLPAVFGGGSFNPSSLMKLPVTPPPSAKFFFALHTLLILVSVTLVTLAK